MKPFVHKKLGITIKLEDLTQAQLEKYQEAIIAKSESVKAGSAKDRLIVEAAVEAGFLLEVTKESLPGMRPAVISWMTKTIVDFVREQRDVPQD
jgi:hypothetical protein